MRIGLTQVLRDKHSVWLVKHIPCMCCVQEVYLKQRHFERLTMVNKGIQANEKVRKLASLVLDKIELRKGISPLLL